MQQAPPSAPTSSAAKGGITEQGASICRRRTQPQAQQQQPHKHLRPPHFGAARTPWRMALTARPLTAAERVNQVRA